MNSVLRKVKIVCTLGPASDTYEKIRDLLGAGMNVARLNFSHGDYSSHERTINNIRAAEKNLDTPIAVLLDTKGPEIRTGLLRDHAKVMLVQDSDFELRFDGIEGDSQGVSVDYAPLHDEVAIGQAIYIDDGVIKLQVVELTSDAVVCRVIVGGELGERKGINVPSADLSVPTLTDKDINDIKWSSEHDVDYIAVSFVRSSEDILNVKKLVEKYGGDSKIIAKIETRQSVERLDEILAVSDGIMVARGDLGVEIPMEDVPVLQKDIIKKCLIQGKQSIVATQMLDSMIRNPRPTRAEASDVANAVIDGTDAVMLSGETASGKYPLEAVKTMNNIIMKIESRIDLLQNTPETIADDNLISDAVSYSTRDISKAVNAAAIVTMTKSGATARMVSKYRPLCRIIAPTPLRKSWRQMALVWGTMPILCEITDELESSVDKVLTILQKEGHIKAGDIIVITSGVPLGVKGTTNTVHVQRVSGKKTESSENTNLCLL